MTEIIIFAVIGYGVGYLSCYRKYDKEVEKIKHALLTELKMFQRWNGRHTAGRR